MKDIPNYEGRYAITKDGDVWSYVSNKWMSKRLNNQGYYEINLGRDKWRVHRLVAITYIENPENLPFVDHIDRCRTNNNVNNLRWVSPLGNVLNRDKDELHKSLSEAYKRTDVETSKERLKRASKVRSKPVEQRDLLDHSILINTYSSSYRAAIELFEDASKNSLINRCAKGKATQAYGYYWCYA